MTYEELHKLYVVKNKSMIEVSNILEMSTVTLRKRMREHNIKARNHSDSMKGRNKGIKNGNYSGAKNYRPRHAFIRRRKEQPKRCVDCLKETDKLDLANISGKYLLDVDDYKYICRRCHMLEDGRMKNLKQYR